MEKYLLNILQGPFVYNLQQNIFGANDLKRSVIESEVDLLEIKTVLDLGCGIGDSTRLFENFDINYLGIDLSKSRIDYAKNNFKSEKNMFKQISVQAFQAEEVFDLVLCFGLIHHLSETEAIKLIKEINRKELKFKKIIFLDPVKVKRQGIIATIFHKLDIGQNIKTQEGYKKYFKNFNIKSEIVYSNKIIKLPIHKVTISN